MVVVPRAGQTLSLEGVQAGDDNVGEDSVDTLSPHTSGISTTRVILTRDSAPTNSATETGLDATSDDSDDANIDLTATDPLLNLYDNRWPIWTHQQPCGLSPPCSS